MKTFVAIEFNDDLKKYLAGVREIVRDNAVKGNFTRDDNFHLTLRYLGDTKTDVIKKLQVQLKEICSKYSISDIKIGKANAFNKGNRSIVFIEPQINDSIREMRGDIEKAVRELGYISDSKTFVPHITLGREINISKPITELDVLIPQYDGKVTAGSVSLMESTRENGKLVYKRIFNIKLKEQVAL